MPAAHRFREGWIQWRTRVENLSDNDATRDGLKKRWGKLSKAAKDTEGQEALTANAAEAGNVNDSSGDAPGVGGSRSKKEISRPPKKKGRTVKGTTRRGRDNEDDRDNDEDVLGTGKGKGPAGGTQRPPAKRKASNRDAEAEDDDNDVPVFGKADNRENAIGNESRPTHKKQRARVNQGRKRRKSSDDDAEAGAGDSHGPTSEADGVTAEGSPITKPATETPSVVPGGEKNSPSPAPNPSAAAKLGSTVAAPVTDNGGVEEGADIANDHPSNTDLDPKTPRFAPTPGFGDLAALPPQPEEDGLETRRGVVRETASNAILPMAFAEGKNKKIMDKARKIVAETYAPTFPGWVGSWATRLGGGGMGVAYLFLQASEHNTILDRVVVKDCFKPMRQWSQLQGWYGDPRDVKGRVHMEIKAMQVLAGRPGGEHCIGMRGTPQVNDDKFHYRLFLDFCPHGSLRDLIRDRALHLWTPVPEPALWAWFESLAEACVLFERGGVEEADWQEDWEMLVHRDLKTDNVWLAAPREHRFPSYPAAIVGDFGIAVMIPKDDPMNPMAYNGGEGTECWEAPEMILYADTTTLMPVSAPKLTGKTNVWGVGAVVARLMARSHNPRGPEYNSGEEPFTVVSKGFSKTLVALVERCVAWDAEQRPCAVELRDEIRKVIKGDGGDLTQGLRTKEVDEKAGDNVLKYAADKYRIGMAIPSEGGITR